MKQQILRYWLAMNAAAFDSTVVPLKAYIGLAVGHAASADAIPALSLQGAFWIFAGAFALGLLNFLDANPVEKLFPAVVAAVPPGAPPLGTVVKKYGAD